jgi:hypothetical protein
MSVGSMSSNEGFQECNVQHGVCSQEQSNSCFMTTNIIQQLSSRTFFQEAKQGWSRSRRFFSIFPRGIDPLALVLIARVEKVHALHP